MQELISEYQKSKKEIKQRLEHFSRIPKEDYFYELCFCILTPQSNAKQCDKAVQNLIKINFKDKKVDPQQSIATIRFHNNKARYMKEMKNKFDEIRKAMDKIKDNQELREWFV